MENRANPTFYPPKHWKVPYVEAMSTLGLPSRF